MSNEMFNQLPTVTQSTLADIICAVQAGTSVQQTLQQVQALNLQNTILFNAGNPNSAVAGLTYQFCWDTTDNALFICTTSGNSATAVWKLLNISLSPMTNGQLVVGTTGDLPVLTTLTAGTGISIANNPGSISISVSTPGTSWSDVTGTTQLMVPNSSYTANNASLVTFTVPPVVPYGSFFNIIGKGAGGWSIVTSTGQLIQIGSTASTVTTGSVSSTNRYDSVNLIATTANSILTNSGAPQGTLTII